MPEGLRCQPAPAGHVPDGQQHLGLVVLHAEDAMALPRRKLNSQGCPTITRGARTRYTTCRRRTLRWTQTSRPSAIDTQIANGNMTGSVESAAATLAAA